MNIFKRKNNSDEKLKHLIQDLHDSRFQLAKEKKILDTFLDDGIVSLVDIDTNEILFLNENGKEEFGKDSIGKKCYQAMHNNNTVCSFCNSEFIQRQDGKLISKIIKDNKNRLCIKKTAYLKIVNGQEKHLRLDKTTVLENHIEEIKKLLRINNE